MTGGHIEDAIRKGKIVVPHGTTPHKGQDPQVYTPAKVIQPIRMTYSELLPTLLKKICWPRFSQSRKSLLIPRDTM
ncbi:hypothetical protein GQ457_09G018980 [Hibiscus cannabinus]